MKSFTTITALAASFALVSAQGFTFNDTTGVFTCSIANGTFCASDSLSSNIIIRCNGFVGQPGNCDDNLAGEFPQGVNFSPCWASSTTPGVAACSKNCIVYGDSGNSDTFTLPNCIPSATPSTTASKTYTMPAGTGVISSNTTSLITSAPYPTTTSSTKPIYQSSSGTNLPIGPSSGLRPWSSNSTSTIHPSGTGVGQPGSTSTTGAGQGGAGSSGGASGSGGSGGLSGSSGSGSSGSSGGSNGASGASGSATATPKSPPTNTITTVPTFTGAANNIRVGSAFAAIGLFASYFL